MVDVTELRKKAEKKARAILNDLLAEQPATALTDCKVFPWSVTCNKGNYNREDFQKWSEGVGALRKASKEYRPFGYRLEYGLECNTQRYGLQRNISEIIFDTAEDLFRFVSMYDDVQFLLSVAQTADCILKDVSGIDIASRPWREWLKSSKNTIMSPKYRESDFWKKILELAAYLAEHPDSGLFPRELPVAVDTKFMEGNHALELGLVRVLRPEVPTLFNNELPWEQQMGLRRKDGLIHLRLPEPAAIMAQDHQYSHIDRIIIPKEDFISFSHPALRRVFVIENETLFLTFPLMEGEIALYRGGFAITTLANVPWMETTDMYYFSDIDEHGFAMLDLMRGMYPRAKNFCMDAQTYDHFATYRVPGKPCPGTFERLSQPERILLERLRSDKELGRLEQEHIDLGYIRDRKGEL